MRDLQNRVHVRERWWMYADHRPGLYRSISSLSCCFVTAGTTKYLNFSKVPADYVYSHTLNVLASERWDIYAVVQSGVHEIWVRKYSGTLKQDLRYSPSKCFETFAFPGNLWRIPDQKLARIGERYHEHRRRLMRELWLGLTGIYNLFHARALTPELVAKISKKPVNIAKSGFEGLLELRRLHVALDSAVRDAYGWHDLDLGHDFVEVETLPENDRVRFTISPTARRELLRRLLALNHERAEVERQKAAQSPKSPAKKTGKRRPGTDVQTGELFGELQRSDT